MKPVQFIHPIGITGTDKSYIKEKFYFLDNTAKQIPITSLFPHLNHNDYKIYIFSLNNENEFNFLKQKQFNIESNDDVILFKMHGYMEITVNNKTLYTMSSVFLQDGVYISKNTPIICKCNTAHGFLMVGKNLKTHADFRFPNKWNPFYSFKPNSKNYLKMFDKMGFKFIQKNLCYKDNKSTTTYVNWDETLHWFYPQLYNTNIPRSVEYLEKKNVNSINYFCVNDNRTFGILGIPGLTTSPTETADFFLKTIKEKLPTTKKIIFMGICKGGYIPILLSHLTGCNSISFEFNIQMINSFLQKNSDNKTFLNNKNIDLFFSNACFNPDIKNNIILTLTNIEDELNLRYFINNVPNKYWCTFNFFTNSHSSLDSFSAFEKNLVSPIL